MKLWYAILIDSIDGSILKQWGPLPLSELEKLIPEPQINDRGEPIERIEVECADWFKEER